MSNNFARKKLSHMKTSILVSPEDHYPLKMLNPADIIDLMDGNLKTLGAFFFNQSSSVSTINN